MSICARVCCVHSRGALEPSAVSQNRKCSLDCYFYEHIKSLCFFFFLSLDDTLSSASFRAQHPPSRDRIRLVTSDAVAGEEAY